MSIQELPQMKPQVSQMEETSEVLDTMIKNPEIMEENFQKTREKLHWELTLNNQVELLGQIVLYELLESHKHFDLYRGMKLTNRERVVVKLINKTAIKQGLTQNCSMLNCEKQYEEYLQKTQIEHEASVSLVNNVTYIFLIRPVELYANSDCIIKVTENYYGEPLSKILLRRGSLTVEEALAVLKEIIFIVSEFHKQNIILTELNPEIIVYKNGVFKISDLSSMRKVGQKFTSTLNLNNSYSYDDLIAPELQVCPEIIDIKSEIWAIGVLFYHLIAHKPAYEERGFDVVKKARSHNISVETRHGPANEEIVSFLRSLMEINPDQRLTWNNLISHPIFQKKEYFNSIKMLPIVDVRPATIKKRKNYIIQEENFANDGFADQVLSKAKPMQSFKEINHKSLLKIVSTDKKIEIQKCLDIESEAFFYIEQTNLMALKAVYIFQEILTRIKQCELIDHKRRSHLETVFLIAQRCQLYMKKSKDYEGKSADRRIENYLEQLKKWSQKIKDIFLEAKFQYESIEKTTYYISNDLISIITNRGSKQKQRQNILKGKEGRDFTVEQMVRFTQQKCINKILSQMKHKGGENQDRNVLEQVKINLINYEKINSITLVDLKGHHCFKDAVTKKILYKNSH